MSKKNVPAVITDLGEKIGGARKDMSVPTGPRKARTVVSDDRPAWSRRFVAMEQIDRATQKGTGKWSLFDMGKNERWGGRALMRDLPSKESAEQAIPMAAVSRNHRVRSAADGKYEIWRSVTDRKNVRVVQQQFDSRDAAMEHMARNAVQIIETKTGFGEEILAKPETVYRTGPQVRPGDIAGESFMKTLGMRGVEFGNWQGERQSVMNHAYDAMRDLADVTGIDPKDVSLKGDLAIAFGARGHGLSSARAHYEPKYGAINLTKLEGAGALAHEWWHGIDHMLARVDEPSLAELDTKSKTKAFKTHLGNGVFGSARVASRYPGKMPEVVRAAYKDLVDSIYRKPEQYVEDKARAEKFTEASRKGVQERLDGIRKDLASKLTYGKRNVNPATAEQMARFDAAAERILSGAEKTEWKHFETKPSAWNPSGGSTSRWTSTAVEEINTVMKEVRGRTGFGGSKGAGTLDYLVGAMKTHASRLDMLKDAAAESTKTKFVPTEYAMQARRLDEGRVQDYWQTHEEMTARAFSAYIEDKLAAQGRRSDYLSYGSDNRLYEWLGMKPFPDGGERQAINAKFDKLFAAMKEAEVVRAAAPTTENVAAALSRANSRAAEETKIGKAPAGWSDEARAASAQARGVGDNNPPTLSSQEAVDRHAKATDAYNDAMRRGNYTDIKARESEMREAYQDLKSTKRANEPGKQAFDRSKLDFKHLDTLTTQELTSLQREIMEDKASRNPAHLEGKSIHIYNKKALAKLDRIAQEISGRIGLKKRVESLKTGNHDINVHGVTTEYRADAVGDPYKFKSRVHQNVGYDENGYPKSAIINANTLDEYSRKVAEAQKAMRDGASAAAKIRAAKASVSTPSAPRKLAVAGMTSGYVVVDPDTGERLASFKRKPEAIAFVKEQGAKLSNKEQTAKARDRVSAAARSGDLITPRMEMESSSGTFKPIGDNGAPPDTQLKAAKRLEEVAKRTITEAEKTINQPRLMNTARRARLGGGVIEEAQRRVALSKTALKIAEALRDGTAGPELAKITSLADIDRLDTQFRQAMYAADRAKNIPYGQSRSGARGGEPVAEDVGYLKASAGVRANLPSARDFETLRVALKNQGVARELKRLEALSAKSQYWHTDPRDVEAIEKVAKAIKAIKDKPTDWAKYRWEPKRLQYDANTWLKSVTEYRGAARLGLANTESLQSMLKSYAEVRSAKAKINPVVAMERELIGTKIAGFFPTPQSLAARMADLADIKPGMTVLEPSAGTGRLADAAKQRGAKVEAIEVAPRLAEILKQKGHAIIGSDFNEVPIAQRYDRIMMNPPFEKGQDMAHVRRAYDMLKPGGKMVAIMGEGAFFRSDKQAAGFREWLGEVGGAAEKLPEGTFKESNTGVNTRLVTITKPGVNPGWSDAARIASAEARGATLHGEVKPTVEKPMSAAMRRALETSEQRTVPTPQSTLTAPEPAATPPVTKEQFMAEAEVRRHPDGGHEVRGPGTNGQWVRTNATGTNTAAKLIAFKNHVYSVSNKLGAIAMIAAPITAAALAYDATKNQAAADGLSPTKQTTDALAAAAAAGTVTAGIGYGIAKGIGLAAKFGPKLIGRALPGVGVGLMAYGAVQGYKHHGLKGAALGLVGADGLLDVGKKPDALPAPSAPADAATRFEVANDAFNAMQETVAADRVLRGFQNPANLASALAAQGKKLGAPVHGQP